ncbi:MAG: DUF4249 domain-containing protein [Prolixibacteraceae bacterium]
MKNTKYISILAIFLLFLSSCEKVIEIDLSDAAEAIVIEATMTSDKLPFIVLISKTSPYFGSQSGNPISGAIVSVRAEGGKPKYFSEKEPGIYILDKNVAITGYWYVVDVEYEGITYSARSYLNEVVPIVDLGFSYFDGLGFFDNGYNVSCYIREPADQENYYRLKYYVNGVESNTNGEISLYTDKLINGKEIGLGQRTLAFEESDTLTVELQSIDQAAYDYFSTLENITRSDWQQNAAPANPVSNFNNGALGYFSAYSYSRKTVFIKNYIKK